MPPLTPEIDDRYDAIELLHEGGATVLYRARHRALGAAHVLRVLFAPVGPGDAARAAVRARAQAQAAVRHPGIARVHNVYEDATVVAVASDHLVGEDAAARVGRGPLPPREAAAIVADLAEALDAAHAAGVVHHELHPGLVMLTGGAPRLAHFSARLVLTHEGPAIPFASPEELLRPGSGDARADVFALGAMLYFLLVGRPPFPAEGREAALQRRLLGDPPPPYGGDVALAAILRAAMGDRVGQRTPSAGALAETLRRWIAGGAPGTSSRATLVPGSELVEAATPVVAVEEDLPPAPVPPAPVPPAPPPSLAPPPRPAPAPRGRGFPRGALLLGVLAVGVFGLLAAAGAWHLMQVQESRRLAAEVMETLERFKTDAATNADGTVLESAVRKARRAIERGETPEAVAAYGLARVWDEHWHYANVKWDEDRYRDTRVVAAAARDTGLAEGVFAHGLLQASACKLLPVSDSRRAGACRDAAADYAEAGGLLRKDPRGWLRFELWWSLAAWNGQRALEALALGDGATAAAAWRDGLAVCQLARPDLEYGPVNDTELGEECVALAGGAGDLDAFLWWAGWLQDDDRASDGKLSSANVERIYRGADPICGKLVVSKKNALRKSLPEYTRETEFCYGAGLLALGCDAQVAQLLRYYSVAAPDSRWQELVGKSSGRRCYLEE